MIAVSDFSTATLPASERIRGWREFTKTPTTAPDESTFEAHLRSGSLGAMRMFALSANRHRVTFDPLDADKQRRFTFKLLFQEAGTLQLEQGGRTVVLTPGHWCIYDKAQPYITSSSDGCQQLGLLIPHDALCQGWFEAKPHLMSSLPATIGVGQVVHASARAAMSAVGTVSARQQQALADTLCDLVRLGLLDRQGAALPNGPVMDLRERVRGFLERNLDDPELDIGRVARAMGCTKRNIHKAFNGSGLTVSEMIWSLRLDRCRRDLQRAEIARVSITEICLAWGFNSSHHFSRMFKQKFGVSPREFRKRVIQG